MNVVRSRCTCRVSVPRSVPQKFRRPTTTAAPKHVPPWRQVPVTASTDHPPTAAEWLSNQCWQSATDRSQWLRDRQILTSLPYPSLSGGSEGPERRTRRSSISGAIWESSRRTRPGSTVAMYETLAAVTPSGCLPTSCLLFPPPPPALPRSGLAVLNKITWQVFYLLRHVSGRTRKEYWPHSAQYHLISYTVRYAAISDVH